MSSHRDALRPSSPTSSLCSDHRQREGGPGGVGHQVPLEPTPSTTSATSLLSLFGAPSWRPSLGIRISENAESMILPDGSQIPLSEVEFEDLSLGTSARWRFKPPTLLQQTIPQPEETILVPLKSAESGLFALGEANGSTWSESRLAGSRALVLSESKAPLATKILRLQPHETKEVVLASSKTKIKEIASPSFLVPLAESQKGWGGLIEALATPRLEKDSAPVEKLDPVFAPLSTEAVKEEFAARTHLLDVLSALTIVETASASTKDKILRPALLAGAKHLLRPLHEANTRWMEAKVACRREALSGIDLSIPWAR